VLLALVITSAESRRSALGAFLVGATIQHGMWFWWALPLAYSMVSSGVPPLLLGGGFLVVVGLPVTALVSVGIWCLHRRAPVSLWLPVAWALGETLVVRWTGIVDDWVSTQVDVARVMRLVRWVGAVPTLLLCLAAAAAAGEWLAGRQRRSLVPVLVWAVFLFLAPPLQKAEPTLLEGIGAVHLRTALELPAIDRLSPRPELLVWPEQILASRLRLEEGPTPRLPTLVPFSGTGMEHIVGVTTLSEAGPQNSLVYVTPRGDIEEVRAKRVLFPVFEEPFLGAGREGFARGKVTPRFEAVGRSVVPLICGEILTRELVAEGVDAGGHVVVVSASDAFQTRKAQASWNVLSQVRLRAIEMGVPVVYASTEGQAAIVDADGTILARSAMDAPSGVLTWSRAEGARDQTPPSAPTAVVLFDRKAPHLRPDCVPGQCRHVAIDEVSEREVPVSTVIVSGHGTGELVAGLEPGRVAAAVAAFSPELVVLDTCFGSSTTLLAAVAKRTNALVVAAPSLLDDQGLVYDPSFFEPGPAARRVLGVNTDPPSRLYVGRPDPAELERLEAATREEPADALRPGVKSWSPALVERTDRSGERVLVPVDWRKIGHPPPPPLLNMAMEPTTFPVRALWLEGADVEHRAELDAFLRCLINESTFAEFFQGKARVKFDGSWVVPLPEGGIETENRNHALEGMIQDLPPLPPGEVPVYLIFGLGRQLPLQSLCGYHDIGVVNHRKAAISLVRTMPPCWPGASPVRSETQIAMHEIAEGIDQALGHRGCVANGRCEGGGGCDRTCDAFTGLFCEGAPEATPTGCEGQVVRGWAVQRLAHKGWEDDNCAPCAPCDFTVERSR
jgi:apolipoprotein N-acyltransferase